MSATRPDRNLALELVRVTEAAALAAGRWVGRGDKIAADQAAVDGMRAMLDSVSMAGVVVIGEGEKDEAPMLFNGEPVGDGTGPEVDVAVDPLEGTRLTALGQPNAIAVIAVAERGTMFFPGAAVYMNKIAVGPQGIDVVDIEALLDDDQPVPDGVVVHARNGHFGGRPETISFDVIAADLPDAVALARAAGQQHTLPGSVGETSGTVDAERGLALIWEVQPNVYKPAGERNRDVARLFRRHRNWHVLTLAAALGWLRGRGMRAYVVRGAALAPAHEVNPAKPVSETIVALHDRTVARVAAALGLQLLDLAPDDEQLLLDSRVMNVGLQLHTGANGLGGAMWRVGS